MNLRTLVLLSLFVASCSAPPAEVASHPPPEKSVARFAVPLDGLPAFGAHDALVTLVEVVDYECPFSKRAEATVRALREKYGRELRIAIVEHPLPMHPHAREASLMALAAEARGTFEQTHRALLDGALEPSLLDSEQALPIAKLARATALVEKLRAHGTPTFFVNGRIVRGAQPLEVFERIVDQELAHARAMVLAGIPRTRVYDTLVAEAEKTPPPFEKEPAPFVAEAKVVGGAHLFGARDAAHTVVLFTDFECPYCARLDARLRELARAHPDLRVVLRHRPLPFHANARLAAKAAIAAEAQGALARYVALLFEHRTALGRDALVADAESLGLDRARFVADLDSKETEARLLEDEALAQKLEVTGTPTSFVDGRRVTGAQPIATFEQALLEKL